MDFCYLQILTSIGPQCGVWLKWIWFWKEKVNTSIESISLFAYHFKEMIDYFTWIEHYSTCGNKSRQISSFQRSSIITFGAYTKVRHNLGSLDRNCQHAETLDYPSDCSHSICCFVSFGWRWSRLSFGKRWSIQQQQFDDFAETIQCLAIVGFWK